MRQGPPSAVVDAHGAPPGEPERRRSFITPLLHLADAVIEPVAPLLSRYRLGDRWVLLEADGRTEIHRIEKGAATRVVRSLNEIDDTALPVRLGKARSVELRLDPSRTITSRIALPLDARGYIDAIIANRLDRLTPWRAGDVVYGTRIGQSRPADGVIDVEIVATSREILDESLSRLRRHGIVPTAAGIAQGPLLEPLAIDLLSGLGRKGGAAGRRIASAALLLLLPLALLAFAASMQGLSSASAQLDEAAGELVAERLRLTGGAGGGDAQADLAHRVIAEKEAHGTRFQMLAALAEAIPDGTFLSELEILPETVRLRGYSFAAPALVPVLEAFPSLENVRFEAPVVREAPGRDRFDIVATRTAETSAR